MGTAEEIIFLDEMASRYHISPPWERKSNSYGSERNNPFILWDQSTIAEFNRGILNILSKARLYRHYPINAWMAQNN